MKKFIIIIAAVLLHSTFADAQVVIRKNTEKNTSTVSTTVVTRNIIYKERPKFDAKVGYQQFVELGATFCSAYDEEHEGKGATGVNYIGGWRFNNWFFAGAGTGLNFSHFCYRTNGFGSLNAVSVPLYLHLRGYYMNTRLAPYSSLSFGGNLCPKESVGYFDFSTGADYRLNSKFHLFASLGFWLRGAKEEYDGEIYKVSPACGMSLRVGVSF